MIPGDGKSCWEMWAFTVAGSAESNNQATTTDEQVVAGYDQHDPSSVYGQEHPAHWGG